MGANNALEAIDGTVTMILGPKLVFSGVSFRKRPLLCAGVMRRGTLMTCNLQRRHCIPSSLGKVLYIASPISASMDPLPLLSSEATSKPVRPEWTHDFHASLAQSFPWFSLTKLNQASAAVLIRAYLGAALVVKGSWRSVEGRR
jgi:hypothetical protein